MSHDVKRLYRSEKDRMLAGVAGGLGEYFHVDSTLVRLAFVAMCFMGGFGFFLYIAMWILVPTESGVKAVGGAAVTQNVEEIKEKVVKAGEYVKGKVENVAEKNRE